MRASEIRQALTAAAASGRVTPNKIDELMLKARDEGGLDNEERVALLKGSDGFEDDTKQRLISHIAAMGQKNGWVSVESDGKLASIEGRYANMTLSVPGLSARIGLFDNVFTLKGRASAPGTLSLTLDGQAIQVPVAKNDGPAAILEKVKAALPPAMTGLLFGGDVSPNAPALFEGRAAGTLDSAAHLMLYKPAALTLLQGEKPLRVVVTGYGKFMGITDNPSANVAAKLAQIGVKGGIVEYRRLDVTPQAVDDFMKDMRAHPPDVILSMGVTGGQSQLEESPENHLGAAVDGNGTMMTEREVIAGGADELHTDFPVETVEWALKKFGKKRETYTSISDASYSADRSAYLCNYIGYNLAAEFGDQPNTMAGFIHVTAHTPPNQIHAVLQAVVAKQLEYRRNPTPVT